LESRDLVRIALLAALIAALGLLPNLVLPIAGGVPITAQTLGVMLAGILLGPRKGALAVLLFLFVVALGAPLLAGGRGGLGVFFGPSAGFLLGFVPGAYATGVLMPRLRALPIFPAAFLSAVGGGILVVYAFGMVGLMLIAKLGLLQALVGIAVFLPGDILKALAAGLIAEAAHRAYPSAVFRRP